MKKLDNEISNWLNKHNIPISKVMDASEYSGKSTYGPVMKQNGFLLATGVTPCKTASHRLRTRHGHCVMCDPTKLRYQQRYSEEAVIYVARASSDKRFVKIGITTNIEGRKQTLNTNGGYAGLLGWEINFQEKVSNAGDIENLIKKRLSEYSTVREYIKNGRLQTATEVFQAPLELVLDQVKKIIKSNKH